MLKGHALSTSGTLARAQLNPGAGAEVPPGGGGPKDVDVAGCLTVAHLAQLCAWSKACVSKLASAKKGAVHPAWNALAWRQGEEGVVILGTSLPFESPAAALWVCTHGAPGDTCLLLALTFIVFGCTRVCVCAIWGRRGGFMDREGSI